MRPKLYISVPVILLLCALSNARDNLPDWSIPIAMAAATSDTVVLCALESASLAVESGAMTFGENPLHPGLTGEEKIADDLNTVSLIQDLFSGITPPRRRNDVPRYMRDCYRLIKLMGDHFSHAREPIINFIIAYCRDVCSDVARRYYLAANTSAEYTEEAP